MILYVNFIEIN